MEEVGVLRVEPHTNKEVQTPAPLSVSLPIFLYIQVKERIKHFLPNVKYIFNLMLTGGQFWMARDDHLSAFAFVLALLM